MTTQSKNKSATFRAATDDLVKTVQSAINHQQLNAADREWLINELDQMIGQLKTAKKAAFSAH